MLKRNTKPYNQPLANKIGKVLFISGTLCIVIGIAGVSATETAAENGNTGANGAYCMVMLLGFAMCIGFWIC